MIIFGIESSRLEEKHLTIIQVFAVFCALAGILSYLAFLRYTAPIDTWIFISSEYSRSISDGNSMIEIPANAIVVSDVKKEKVFLRTTAKSVDSFIRDFPKSNVIRLSSPLSMLIGSVFLFALFFGIFWEPMTKKFLSELT